MIHIFTTGGSIDKHYSTLISDFEVGAPQIEPILAQANLNLSYTLSPLMQKDSLDLSEADRAIIFQAVATSPHRQIIITHGTDSMTLTGQALAPIADKVIVITGAMQPAGFKDSDAAFNIGAAVLAVQTLPNGVYIVMNGRVFDPHKVYKITELNRFEEQN